MQFAFSFDACVALPLQHAFPPAKDELAANTPAANNAKVVLIMHLRQHESGNVQWVPIRKEVEVILKTSPRIIINTGLQAGASRPKMNTSRFNGLPQTAELCGKNEKSR